MNEIPPQYNPKQAEDKWYEFWQSNNLFAAKVGPAKKPFCIVIPPPNITGILHMGHALNNTIQDILIRYHRMKGEEALWMPGTDHAGIATQNVVEKAIAKEGLRRQDLGRQNFIERVWRWREQYGSTIIRQLKKLGASCDWPRERFTMDEEYSKAVMSVFIALWDKGLIYQDDKVINWCPRCQTALSDEEAPRRQLQGNLYYLKYPFKKEILNPKSEIRNKSKIQNSKLESYIVVATTRPETMLGDTAVAVNPKDKRYKKFIGKTLILPLMNREIKIIADAIVDTKFGTGAVKVTPAHDPNDYLLGKKHRLDFITVMYPDARMNENAGRYKDMDRLAAREAILKDLTELGLLEKVQPHQLSAGHCYRCHTIIEPYLSRQWFVKMKPLAKPAIEAVKKGKIKFHPKRWTKVYLNWMENIQDWCISRQIWWGHRLPLYYCKKCQEDRSSMLDSRCSSRIEDPCLSGRQGVSRIEKGIIVSRVKPNKCPTCGSGDIVQDEDVLDTWFSSWLWPFATFGWPNQLSVDSCQLSESANLKTENRKPKTDLEYFYPTSVLVTAPEIIFFWVARMIMAGLEFTKDIPFKDVYIHGTVRDIEGKKMSKSLGNIIDPLEVIDEYGTDALRFSLISITAGGQDVYLSKERFEQGRNFANKIWNASRFILMNLDPAHTKTDLADQPAAESLVNRWILSRFYSVLKELNKDLDNYKFNEAANLLYGFFWHEFCDWYLEMIKVDIRNPDNQLVMYKVLEKSLRLLHPFMPFISEDIWQLLRLKASIEHRASSIESIMIQPWPHIQQQMINKETEAAMQAVFDIIITIRNLRHELGILPQQEIPAVISLRNNAGRALLDSLSKHIIRLAKLSRITVQPEYKHIRGSIAAITGDIHISLLLEGVLDLEKERLRIEERIRRLQAEIKSKEKTLNNREFAKKAPEEIVQKEKAKLSSLKETFKKLKAVKDGLG